MLPRTRRARFEPGHRRHGWPIFYFPGFYLPKWWFVKSFKFSDFSRWYFFLNEFSFFKEIFFIRSDDSKGLFTKLRKVNKEMQCCQMFYKTFREGNFKFKFNVNKDHKWNFQLNFQRTDWCLNVEIRHNKIQISLILPKNREVKIFKINLSKMKRKK